MPQSGSRNSFQTDFEILLEQQGFLKMFFIKVRSFEEFMLLRISIFTVVLLAVLGLGVFTLRNTLVYAIAAALLCYFIPPLLVKRMINLKSRAVLGNLPDVIDLMASLLKAGLTLDEVISYIANNYINPVSRLFRIYRLRLLSGSSRAEAFDAAGRMSYCTEFKSFIKIIYQAEITGHPVSDILKDLSRVYRNNQRDFLKIQAEKLESNLIIVIFVFIFVPMLFILMVPVLPQLKIFI